MIRPSRDDEDVETDFFDSLKLFGLSTILLAIVPVIVSGATVAIAIAVEIQTSNSAGAGVSLATTVVSVAAILSIIPAAWLAKRILLRTASRRRVSTVVQGQIVSRVSGMGFILGIAVGFALFVQV